MTAEQIYLGLACFSVFNIALLMILTFFSLLTQKHEPLEVKINEDVLLAKPKKDKR